jgi:hypothetical protein
MTLEDLEDEIRANKRMGLSNGTNYLSWDLRKLKKK